MSCALIGGACAIVGILAGFLLGWRARRSAERAVDQSSVDVGLKRLHLRRDTG